MLRPRETPAGNADRLRQQILRGTRRVLWQRRVLRRAGWVSALAACYAAGFLTMRWTAPATPMSGDVQLVSSTPHPNPPPQGGREPTAGVRPSAEVEASDPLTQEWRAVESREGRAELYRRAGDSYFEQKGDLESAARCYRSALRQCSAADLAISVDDNWLLMALKVAKAKEKRNAKMDS